MKFGRTISFAAGVLMLTTVFGCSSMAVQYSAPGRAMRAPSPFPFRLRIGEAKLSLVAPEVAPNAQKRLLRMNLFEAEIRKILETGFPQFFTVEEKGSMPVTIDVVTNVGESEPYGARGLLSVLTLGLVPVSYSQSRELQIIMKIDAVEARASFVQKQRTWESLGILGALLQTHRWHDTPPGYVKISPSENKLFGSEVFFLDTLAAFDREKLLELYYSKYGKHTELIE